MRISVRGVFLILLLLALTVASTGCEFPIFDFSQSHEALKTTQVSGQVELPTGSSVAPSDLTAVTALSSSTVSEAGGVELTGFADSSLLIALETPSGNPSLLGYAFTSKEGIAGSGSILGQFIALGSSPVRIGPSSTALALIMITPLLLEAPPDIKAQFAAQAMQHEQFDTLVNAIRTAFLHDPEHVLDVNVNFGIYELAIQIARDVFDNITAGSGALAGQAAQPEGLYRIYRDRPWLEDDTGPMIRVKNPRFIWYSASVDHHDKHLPMDRIG